MVWTSLQTIFLESKKSLPRKVDGDGLSEKAKMSAQYPLVHIMICVDLPLIDSWDTLYQTFRSWARLDNWGTSDCFRYGFGLFVMTNGTV